MTLYKKVLTVILFVSGSSLQVYKDIKNHPEKKVIITSTEARILNAPNSYKFFVSFWVQYTTTAYLRHGPASDRFVVSMVTNQNECKVMEPGFWAFFLLAYDIAQTNPGSYVYKLTPLGSQRQGLPYPQNCKKNKNPACTCPGRPDINFDSIFKDAVTVVSGGSHLFDLSQFDGGGGRPLVWNVMSGVADYKGALPVVSYNTMAELMKGPMEEIKEVSFMNMDYATAQNYLHNYPDDLLYDSFNRFGIRVHHDSLISLGRHKMSADSESSIRFFKNFCFSLSFVAQDSFQSRNQIIKVKIEMAVDNDPKTSATDYQSKEDLVMVLTLQQDPSTTPNKIEFIAQRDSIAKDSTKIEGFGVASDTNLELNVCLSWLIMTPNTAYQQFQIKMVTKNKNNLAEVQGENYANLLQYYKDFNPKIDTKTFFRDLKVTLDKQHHVSPLQDIEVNFHSFWVTTGGMIEYPESSYDVANKPGGGFGVLDNCLLEIDSENRRCLGCSSGSFYDQGTGQCVECKSKIEGCGDCRRGDWCDSCSGYHNRFGGTACLADLKECIAPKYSRYNAERCDSCDGSAPNGCKCGSNYRSVESKLGGGVNMCVCKIEGCKFRSFLIHF